ncbi:hypothetical protein ACHAXH_008947 [Discostella pseudostelligera]
MTSAQYLTLEEFLSSPSSLPTILLPRSHALRLVHLCELAEMTPPPDFLNFLFQSTTTTTASDSSASSDAAADGNNNGAAADTAASSGQRSSLFANGNHNGNYNRHILVTQMALLLYLGEYTHAQHLWSRHATATVGAGVPVSSSSNNTANNSDYVQLEQLWNAAKFMSLWNTGGMHNNFLVPSSNQQQTNNNFAPPPLTPQILELHQCKLKTKMMMNCNRRSNRMMMVSSARAMLGSHPPLPPPYRIRLSPCEHCNPVKPATWNHSQPMLLN